MGGCALIPTDGRASRIPAPPVSVHLHRRKKKITLASGDSALSETKSQKTKNSIKKIVGGEFWLPASTPTFPFRRARINIHRRVGGVMSHWTGNSMPRRVPPNPPPRPCALSNTHWGSLLEDPYQFETAIHHCNFSRIHSLQQTGNNSANWQRAPPDNFESQPAAWRATFSGAASFTWSHTLGAVP